MNVEVKYNNNITFSPDLSSRDELANYWLRQATIRLRREIAWCWNERGSAIKETSTGLPPFVDKAVSSLNMMRHWEEKKRFFELDPTARYLTEQLNSVMPDSEAGCARGSFSWAVRELQIDDTASFVLALGLLTVFDSAAGSVISACLNDPASVLPTMRLAQRLWDDYEGLMTIGDPTHPLFSYGLLQPGTRSLVSSTAIRWDDPLIIPAPVAGSLLFPETELLNTLEKVPFPDDDEDEDQSDVRLTVARLRNEESKSLRIIPILGAKGSRHVEIAARIARYAGRPLVKYSGDPCFLEDTNFVITLATYCWLKGIDLFFDHNVSAYFEKNEKRMERYPIPFQSLPVVYYISLNDRKQLDALPEVLVLPSVKIPRLTYHTRLSYWKAALGKKGAGLEAELAECARRFRYERDTIDAVACGIRRFPGPISNDILTKACRAEVEPDLGSLAQFVVPRFTDEKLILPPKENSQFKEIVKAMKSLTEVHYSWGTYKVWNEGGISVLFSGPPGTGKTMAAEILAIELNLPMFRIDLSQVVNKYIGETEKNLKKLFDAADISDIILFFDEADSLFGHRTEVKDAHDRYANLEISFLLERMERFKGLAILATNRKKDLDKAFLRRLRYIVDFPLPGLEQRKFIWRQVLPKNANTSEIDTDFLAAQFPLTGGHIRSIVFNACLQCARLPDRNSPQSENRLTMEQIIISIKREYDKLDRAINLDLFGPYRKIVEQANIDVNN
jgi:hypothetical protein